MGPTTQPDRGDGDLPAGADGDPNGAKADDPAASRSTVTFLDRGPASEMVLRLVSNSKPRRDEVVEQCGAIEGGKQTLGRLAAYVAAMTEAAARK